MHACKFNFPKVITYVSLQIQTFLITSEFVKNEMPSWAPNFYAYELFVLVTMTSR
jgi:hypothetical protein